MTVYRIPVGMCFQTNDETCTCIQVVYLEDSRMPKWGIRENELHKEEKPIKDAAPCGLPSGGSILLRTLRKPLQ